MLAEEVTHWKKAENLKCKLEGVLKSSEKLCRNYSWAGLRGSCLIFLASPSSREINHLFHLLATVTSFHPSAESRRVIEINAGGLKERIFKYFFSLIQTGPVRLQLWTLSIICLEKWMRPLWFSLFMPCLPKHIFKIEQMTNNQCRLYFMISLTKANK